MKPMTHSEAGDVLKRRKLHMERHEPQHEASHKIWAEEIYALNLAISALEHVRIVESLGIPQE